MVLLFLTRTSHIMNTTLSLEEFSHLIGYAICILLIPTFLIPQRSIKQKVFKELQKRFLEPEEISYEEFYSNPSEIEHPHLSSEESFFFEISQSVTIDELEEILEKILRRSGYLMQHSCLTGNSLSILDYDKKGRGMQIKIMRGSTNPCSFQIEMMPS